MRLSRLIGSIGFSPVQFLRSLKSPNSLYPRLSATSRPGRSLSRVICDHSDYLLIRVEFHELASLRALLIDVVKDNAGDSPHHIQKFEMQMRVRLKPFLKITAYRFFTLDGSGGVTQQLCRRGRCEN